MSLKIISKKGQTATEYMIILAVVIIIALIVVGVLGGIPGIGVGARSKASAAYWKTAPIAITSYSASAADDSVVFYVRNNLPDSITINEINYSASGSTSAIHGAENTVMSIMDETSVTLGPGQEKEFTQGAGGVNICNEAGDSYTTNIAISYTDDETGATYLFTGEGNKLEGVCAN